MLCLKLPVSSVRSSSAISCTVGNLNHGLALGKLDRTRSLGIGDHVALDHPASPVGLAEGRGTLRGGVGALGNELNFHRSILSYRLRAVAGLHPPVAPR